MHTYRFTYMKNILIPCLLFSGMTGIFTGLIIFLFKLSASTISQLSGNIYAFIRSNPTYLPLLLAGAILLGLGAALILRWSPNCRGGGIPTAVAILRGLISFSWVKSIFLLFASAMLTYLGGIPLGNEGPSIQMGTAVGCGTVRIFTDKKNRAWDRYIMTGGACAGFAAATGAPLSGIFFAFEEAHRRFSPMIFMVAAVAVVTGTLTTDLLSAFTGISDTILNIPTAVVLPTQKLWAALIVGLVCGLCATLFTKVYRLCGKLIKRFFARVPFLCKVVAIFLLVALIGFIFPESLGSGHSIIDALAEGHGVWYFLLLCLAVRAILLILANHIGITGGLFVPTLTFGAIIGALCARGMSAIGILEETYSIVMIMIGMAAFLSASSRTPITAITFAIEALCGLSNILPIAVGVTIAYLTIETIGVTVFNDTVLEKKVETENAGKTAQIIDTHLSVIPGSFIVGKEIRDILWPPTCTVLSVQKNTDTATRAEAGISAGDVLHVHYQTYDPEKTRKDLEALVGEQLGDTRDRMHIGNENHKVPEIS